MRNKNKSLPNNQENNLPNNLKSNKKNSHLETISINMRMRYQKSKRVKTQTYWKRISYQKNEKKTGYQSLKYPKTSSLSHKSNKESNKTSNIKEAPLRLFRRSTRDLWLSSNPKWKTNSKIFPKSKIPTTFFKPGIMISLNTFDYLNKPNINLRTNWRISEM